MIEPTDHVQGSLGMRAQLLYLKRWPDFSKEVELSQVRNVARICALLSRKPTVGFLVHRAVDLPSDCVGPLLDQLLFTQSIGVFQVGIELSLLEEPSLVSLISSESSDENPTLPAPLTNAADAAQTALAVSTQADAGQTAPSLLKKVWGRFIPN